MRVAAIDIGTNTALMLVAERRPDGAVVAVEDHAEITRLGRGVDRTKRLDDAAVARTLEVLRGYAARAQALGVARIAAVATSASRDAENGAEFRARAAECLGVGLDDVAIADGTREAQLTFAGALGGLGLRDGSRVGVIDVGGGSTELAIGVVTAAPSAAALEWSHSYDVGSVRLTERHVRADPPSGESLSAIEASVRAALSAPAPPTGALAAVVAIAGTATTFAAIDRKLVRYEDDPPHGHRLTVPRIRALTAELAGRAHEERCHTVGLDPRRADVIIAGGVILALAAERLAADAVTVSDRGVRWGLAFELLDR